MTDVRSFEAAFRSSPDVSAVLDARGTITAVNAAWDAFAGSDPPPARTGVGTDYLGVCRRAAQQGAPRAAEAHTALSAVLAGRAHAGSVVYPCTVPAGVRWFRADVFATGHRGTVLARHVDVTADLATAAGTHVADLTDGSGVLAEAALMLTLADVLDDSRRVAALVLVTALERRHDGGCQIAAIVSDLRAGRVAVDVVARLGADHLAVVVTDADAEQAWRTADAVTGAGSPTLGGRRRWGIAACTTRDDAAAVVARARRASVPPGPGDPAADPDDPALPSQRLHRAAAALVEAVAAYDRALDRGAPLPELVTSDRVVHLAELECARAGALHSATTR